jgi:hypothetical protein
MSSRWLAKRLRLFATSAVLMVVEYRASDLSRCSFHRGSSSSTRDGVSIYLKLEETVRYLLRMCSSISFAGKLCLQLGHTTMETLAFFAAERGT